jgi:acetate kinase
MDDAILVINSGSSTIKFSLFSSENKQLKRQYKGVVDRITTQPELTIEAVHNEFKLTENIFVSGEPATFYKQSIEHILRWLAENNFKLIGAGHRIAHGGQEYIAPVILTTKILTQLGKLNFVMPLHQPYNLKGVEILQETLPTVTQVGCFDTSFHVTCNPISQHFALPKRFTDDGIRRFGFHGLSYEYIASELPNCIDEQQANGKFVLAHLGSGASMCALKNLKSVATTLGLTAVGGLPMGTRCDALDPGTVLYLLDVYKLTTNDLLNILYKESGLLGVSGLSADMRVLLASDKPEAKLAVDIFVHRISIYAGLLAAELQGFDGLVFTGGIGENAGPVREQACAKMDWLGVELDSEKNRQRIKVPTKISTENSKPVWVIPTDEELMIAKHTFELMNK